MNALKTLTLVVLGLALAGCTPTVRSDVTQFHKMPVPNGETIVIVAKDEGRKGSLELESYAGQIRARLAALGYEPVSDMNADLLVRVDFGVSEPTEKIRSTPGSSFSYYRYRWGYYNPYWYGFHDPFHHDRHIYSVTQYQRRLELDIVRNGGSGEVLFEGRVESIGRNNSLPEVMPYLVQAMFTNFPGESGVTKRVIIDRN